MARGWAEGVIAWLWPAQKQTSASPFDPLFLPPCGWEAPAVLC